MTRTQKLSWVSGVALAAAAFTTMASAADLPTRKAPPAPMMPLIAPYSWTGFYIGATAGGIWNTGHTSLDATYRGATLGSRYIPTTLGSGETGFQGGGELGYNYQMGSIVLGLESDLEWVTNSNSVTYTGAAIPHLGGDVTTTLATRMDWLGTTRGRLGIATLADDRLLLYVTGGLAYGGGKASVSAVGPAGDAWYGSQGSTQVGWTVGGGAEYAFTNNWSIKAEYLYYNLGSYSYATTGTGPSATPLKFVAKVTPEGSIARAGINYKF